MQSIRASLVRWDSGKGKGRERVVVLLVAWFSLALRAAAAGVDNWVSEADTLGTHWV